jgi:RNA polymerase primary sigma factor
VSVPSETQQAGEAREVLEAAGEEVAELLARGQEQGYLAIAEIQEQLRDLDLTAEQLEGVLFLLHDQGVEVLDTEEHGGGRARRRGRAVSAPGRRAGTTSDSIRLYLREIGRVSLLCAEVSGQAHRA